MPRRVLEGTPDPPKKKGKYARKEDKEAEDPISCVNVKLNSIWNPSFVALDDTFVAFEEVINKVVMNWNKISLEAGLFANFHMLRLIRETKPLPKINQDLYEACCRVVTNGSKERKEEEIRISFEQFKALRPQGEGVDYTPPTNKGSSQLISNLRRQMEVNAKNHVITNFVRRMIRYVRSRFSLSRKDAWTTVKGIFDAENTEPSETQQVLKVWLVYDPLNDDNLKSHLDHFFRLTYDMLLHQESLDPMTKGKKTFSLLPVSGSYIPSHAILDRTTLRGVLQNLPALHRRIIGTRLTTAKELVSAALERETFNFSVAMFRDEEFSAEIWRFLFRVEPMETCNRRFAYGLSTNGYDVSLRFRVSGRQAAASPRMYSPENFDRFVGIDPGKTYIATGFATTFDSDAPETSQFSAKEYRHRSKMNEQRAWEKRLRERETRYETIIRDMPSMKSSNVEEAIRYRITVADWMFRFCRDKAFLKWRFKTKIYSQKALAELSTRMTGGKQGGRTIVGLGDWSQQDGFKGLPKAPIKRMRNALKKRAVVLDVDEYMTSKTCSGCQGMDAMEHVKVNVERKGRDGVEKRRLVKCHQILRCKNIDCRTCWQRDLNASRNIHDLLWGLLSGEERPPAMSRSRM